MRGPRNSGHQEARSHFHHLSFERPFQEIRLKTLKMRMRISETEFRELQEQTHTGTTCSGDPEEKPWRVCFQVYREKGGLCSMRLRCPT